MESHAIRIVCVTSTLRRCSANQVLVNVLRHLDRQRFAPTVLTLSPEPADTMLPQVQALDIPYHSLGLSRVQGVVLAARQIQAFMQQQQPDLVQTQGLRADLIAARQLGQFLRIARMDNYPYADFPATFGKPLGWWMAYQNIRAWQQINCIIACSESIAAQVRGHGVDPVAVPNGVDEQDYQPASPAERQQLRQQLGVPPDQRILISVGALSSRKDPLTLLAAFLQSGLAADTLLLFVGDGPLRQACEARAAGHPNVRFTGHVRNVHEYLRAADLFCSASRSEGLPYAVLEAVACGLPVCLSDIPPHREILQYHRQAGVMFAPQQVNALTALLNTVPGWQHERMAAAARSIVAEHLNARQMSLAYQRVYAEVYARGC